MNTFWLTCRDGPITKREEVAWGYDTQPVYFTSMHNNSHHNSLRRRPKINYNKVAGALLAVTLK